MTAIGIEVRGMVRSRRSSLAKTLRANGIHVMPTAWAQEHKREFLRVTRNEGYGPWTSLILRSIRWLLWASSFAFIPIIAEREDPDDEKIGIAYIASIVLLAIGGGVSSVIGNTFHWWALIPLASAVVTGFLELYRRDADHLRLAYSTSHWVSYRLLPGSVIGEASPALRARAERASKIAGVRVYREELSDDPLVYAVRGWGPFKEACYLGGYNTHNPRIDQF